MHKFINEISAQKLSIRHLWFFVTESCNLSCSYCFYRHRTQNKSISLKYIPLIFSYFEKACAAKFVISGGEALMDWQKTQKIISYLRSINSQKYILLQTNATLLDMIKIEYLAKNRVHIEIGLDGTDSANSHRKGLAPHLSRVEKNIRLASKSGINVHVTMAVCPDKVRGMYDNFIYLLGLNIKKIEVTPCAFTDWKNTDINGFKESYIKILKFTINNRITKTLGTEYDEPLKESNIDIILMPDGTILNNWALLSLTKRQKSRCALFKIEKNRIMINYDCLMPFPERRKTTHKVNTDTTYREISTTYAKLAWRTFGTNGWHKAFSCYSDICDFLKEIHQKFLIS